MYKLLLILLFTVSVFGQSVSKLENCYSGKIFWNESEKSIIFKTSGTINFSEKIGNGNDLRNDQKILQLESANDSLS